MSKPIKPHVITMNKLEMQKAEIHSLEVLISVYTDKVNEVERSISDTESEIKRLFGEIERLSREMGCLFGKKDKQKEELDYFKSLIKEYSKELQELKSK